MNERKRLSNLFHKECSLGRHVDDLLNQGDLDVFRKTTESRAGKR